MDELTPEEIKLLLEVIERAPFVGGVAELVVSIKKKLVKELEKNQGAER